MTIINGGVMPEACVLTIGKFEGMHLGHQALLAGVSEQARRLKLASAAMVFDPHPNIFFNGPGYKPLFTNNERNCLLDLDYLYYCRFDKNFAELSAEDFCKFLFVDCKAVYVIVGKNFCFGKSRVGDTTFLQHEAVRYGSKVEILPIRLIHNHSINTSSIRSMIAQGKLKEARQLLGFPFFVMGVIENRLIRLPEDKFLPPPGIYASNTIVDDISYNSITQIGAQVENDYMLNGLDGRQVKIEFLDLLEITPSGE